MDIEIGHIQAIYRYPVKSMTGESLERTQLGWYGLEGDRRFAFRRPDSLTTTKHGLSGRHSTW